jgi:hypothetical protein
MKPQKKLERELAEFMDDRIITHYRRIRGGVGAPEPLKLAPKWYQEVMCAVAKDVAENYL